MWPERGEALDHTIRVEAAVSDLYAEALRRWAPTASASILPALTASTLPPEPAAMAQTQTVWDQHADEIIAAGLAIVWAVAVCETAKQFGENPDAATPDVSTIALGIVLGSLLIPEREVLEAVGYVNNTPALAAARDQFLEVKRAEIARTPQIVQAKVEAAINNPAVTMSVIPEDRPEILRALAADVMEPGSTQMRDIARNEGYQAAEVLNHAIVTAAAESDEDLDKCWIATLDGKTRPTHWAADGQRAPLAGAFTIGAAQLAFPGDPAGPPEEVKNCRCRLGILAKDEDIPDEVDRHTERLDGRDSVAINRDGRTQAEEIERRADDGNIRARDDPEGIGRVASAAPIEQENNMAKTETRIERQERVALELAAEDTAEDTETYLTFTDALFAVTGVPTSDGRMLSSDIELEFRDTPMPLQWCEKMEGGHYGSVTVGVIEKIAFAKGEVRASGYMLNIDEALKAIELVSHGVCNPSVDLGKCNVIFADSDGVEVTEETYVEGMDVFSTVTKAEVMATTIVAIPAFGQTRINLNEQREARAKSLVASAADSFKPRVYDPALFADPKLTGPTLLTMTDDGHIFGHIACWGEKHRSVQLKNMSAPRSKSGYRHFHTSPPVHLADGTKLPVGRLTVGTGHANTAWDTGPALEHYDNTGTCFALVHAYEDEFGLAVSGVGAPWATAEQIEMGMSAPLSGDWRWIDGNYELVAALAVNTPGFIVRSGTGPNGTPRSLVASLGPSPRTEVGGISHLSVDDIKAAVTEGVLEANRRATFAAHVDTVFAEAEKLAGPPMPVLTLDERMDALLAEHI